MARPLEYTSLSSAPNALTALCCARRTVASVRRHATQQNIYAASAGRSQDDPGDKISAWHLPVWIHVHLNAQLNLPASNLPTLGV